MEELIDVVIIGAGPAGSLAATLLARGGRSVTLVEQHAFPRDKVCGECLSALGIAVLRRCGLEPSLLPLRPVAIRRAILHAASGASFERALPETIWGLPRRTMDAALRDAAAEAGVRVLQPARCEGVVPPSGGDRPFAVVRARELPSNRVAELRCRFVLLADGKAAFAVRRPAPTGDLGIKAHFRDVDGPRDAVELFGVRGHYGGLAAVGEDVWNAAFSVPARRLRASRGDLDRLFAEFGRENPTLGRRFARALRVGDWQASPLPRFAVGDGWAANVIPMGNSAAALEPVGGEGMGLALRSAEAAAAAVGAALDSGRPLDAAQLRRQFDRLWRTRRAACRAVAILMSRPWISGIAITAAGRASAAVDLALRCMGKHDAGRDAEPGVRSAGLVHYR